MKKINKYLAQFLSEFKWYRKKKGGKWFWVYCHSGYNTFDGASQFWTQTPGDAEIIKQENY